MNITLPPKPSRLVMQDTGRVIGQDLQTGKPITEKLPRVFRVRDCNLSRVQSEIEKLNRRGAKLGCEPIVLLPLGHEDEPIYANLEERAFRDQQEIIGYTRFHLFHVEGSAPKFAGWTLAAVIEHTPEGNLLRKAPGCEVELAQFRTVMPECAHCNTVRNRHDTFVVIHEETGEQKQVGRSCIRDFLGHQSPERIVSMGEIFFTLDELLDDAEGADFMGCGEGDRPLMSCDRFLQFAACAIRHFGFISGRRAQESNSNLQSSACTARYWMSPPKNDRSKVKSPEAVDVERAKAARRYVLETLGTREAGTLSDFEHNLLTACRADAVEPRNAGLLAFVVEYHARETEKSLRRASEAAMPQQHHSAAVGTRVRKESIKYVRSIGYESAYGPGYFHLFTTLDGACTLKWSTGNEMEEVGPGTVYCATFTVKDKGEYNGRPQTAVSRMIFH